MTIPDTSQMLQVLTADDVVARLRALRARQPVQYFAFYSSQLGGIVTDPSLMVLPFEMWLESARAWGSAARRHSAGRGPRTTRD